MSEVKYAAKPSSVEPMEVGPTKPISKKAQREAARQTFFEGVTADFDVDLDALRQAWVDWQFLSRRRAKSRHPYERLRLDFTPALERIYTKYSHGRHIALHNIGLLVTCIVYFCLTVYEMAVDFSGGVVLQVNRGIVFITIVTFVLLTRFSRWKSNLKLHLFALNTSFVLIVEAITLGQYYENEPYAGGYSSTLVVFAAFLMVDTSFPVQLLSGIICGATQVVYLYINEPFRTVTYYHAVLASSLIAIIGGSIYLYTAVRLNRKLFLDQVLARLQSYQLEREKDRLNDLLHVILPKTIAARLKAGEQPISDRFEDATVMFVEVLEFEAVVAASTPLQAVKKLNKLYARFDAVCEKNHVMRIKIIGTTYMAICGIPSIRQHHAELACTTALAIQEELKSYCAETNIRLGVRMGINCGPLVAGVIGVQKFCYDVWGDTVNTAARMCTHAAPGAIQTTAAVRAKIEFAFDFAAPEEVFIKGKGKMATHNLVGKKIFERRTAPVPQLDFTSFSLDVSKAGDFLLDGSRLARPHLDRSASLTDVAPPIAPRGGGGGGAVGAARGSGLREEQDDLESSNAQLLQTEPAMGTEVTRNARELATRSQSRGSSDESSDTITIPRQRSSVISQGEGRLQGIGEASIPGQVDESEGELDGRLPPSASEVARNGLASLARGTGFDDSLGSSRTDLSGSESDLVFAQQSGNKQTGGLNRFRESLLRSASFDVGSESERGVPASSARFGPSVGPIDTHRMQRARNLAMAFGFDGRSEADKDQAERAHFAVTKRLGFVRFADPAVERTFDEHTTSMGYARVGYVWAIVAILTGVIYDYLSFANAADIRRLQPYCYTPEQQATGQLFADPTLTLLKLIGYRLSMVPPLIIVLMLTYTRCAVRILPALSVFTILWGLVAEMLCQYASSPPGLVLGGSRLFSLIGSTAMIVRRLNVWRQVVAMFLGFALVCGMTIFSDPTGFFIATIATYTLPLFVTTAIIRSRLQMAQRTYFIERTKVARRSKDIVKEQDKANQLLINIFPKTIYERIKRGEREIVDNHKAAVVLFADVVGFTKLSMEYTPGEIVETLNEIFSAFDALMGKYQLEKIKTIGDCFVCSAGVSAFNTSPFSNMALCALEMVSIIEGMRTTRTQKVEMRWGIHTGDVISAVVGEKKFLYDIFGAAVQTANLMESSSVAGRVLVSEPVAVALQRDGFVLKQHKVVQTHTGAALNTHFLLGRRKSGRVTEATNDDGMVLDPLSAHELGVTRALSTGSVHSVAPSPTLTAMRLPSEGEDMRSSASLSGMSVSAGSDASDARSDVALLERVREEPE